MEKKLPNGKTMALCAVHKSKIKLLFFFILLLIPISILYLSKHWLWCAIYFIKFTYMKTMKLIVISSKLPTFLM